MALLLLLVLLLTPLQFVVDTNQLAASAATSAAAVLDHDFNAALNYVCAATGWQQTTVAQLC